MRPLEAGAVRRIAEARAVRADLDALLVEALLLRAANLAPAVRADLEAVVVELTAARAELAR